MTTLNTNGWNEFPFTVNGHNFVSKIAPFSPFLARIANLPEGMFEMMNKSAVNELIGSLKSREEIVEKLVQINEGASHAVIEIV